MIGRKQAAGVILGLALALAVAGDGAAADRLSMVRVDSVSAFFTGTPAGTVAFLPGAIDVDAAKRTWEFRVLGRDGAYRIPRQASCWFIVNHRDVRNPAGEATYVGVQTVLYRGRTPDEPLFVYRNAGWMRPDEKDVGGGHEIELSARDPEKFVTLHEAEDVHPLDSFLGVKWHAVPNGSDDYSWAKKVYWQRKWSDFQSAAFRGQFSPPVPNGMGASYQNYLLAFRNTHRDVSGRPVLFTFDCLNADYAWLHLFSPNRFQKEYYLAIE